MTVLKVVLRIRGFKGILNNQIYYVKNPITDKKNSHSHTQSLEATKQNLTRRSWLVKKSVCSRLFM